MSDSTALPGAAYPLELSRRHSKVLAWISTVDHKQIGIIYMITSFVFFVVGGLEAMAMRLQLVWPRANFLSPEAYNQLFTMHGTTMIFLVVMPLLIGFGNYFVPLMIGARDMAFPRLNALSAWLLIAGGILLYASFLSGSAPNAGWFAYPPLTERPFSTSAGMDYWAIAQLALGISTVAAAINLIVTILKMRAPGLRMNLLPVFVWMQLINSFLILLALPVLNASVIMLLIDRLLTGNFFKSVTGGSPILWQHFFWMFGHPEVYIMVLPAFGMISEIIPVFSRKPIFGYGFIVGSGVAIAFLSYGVWVHHMFSAGLGHIMYAVFAASSMLIAVPTGVKIFNWAATLWGGAIRLTTAMLFAIAFLLEFTIGGLSGVMFAAVPIDWQTTDTYFVVAHFHYVLFGGTAFAILAAVHYWFPKITGRMLNEQFGRWTFWLMIIGFNATFFPQHFLGLMGMPRRVFTYPDLPGWGALNLLSTIGAAIMFMSILLFVVNLYVSLYMGEPAGDNPWNAWTLEWAASSPPAEFNFKELPPIQSRRPLWDYAHPENPDSLSTPLTASAEPSIPDRPRLSMMLFVLSEAMFFLILIGGYVYFRGGFNETPGTAVLPPSTPEITNPGAVLDPVRAGIYSVFLLSSSLTMWMAERSARQRNRKPLRLWLAATIALGAVFLYGELTEFAALISRGVTISRDIFGSTFYTMTGFHGFHVLGGLVLLSILLGLAFKPGSESPGPTAVDTIAIYWHFVDFVWIIIFSVVYIWALV